MTALDPWRGAVGLLVAIGFALAATVGAWRRARGTALRPALVWVGTGLALVAVGAALAGNETAELGRPIVDQWLYLATLSALASFLTVLNARNPGGGAWALLMAMLLVVFLLPWLEGAGLVRQREGWDRLRLAVPWNYFFAMLAFAGVTNFLPTRYGPAAAIAGLGFMLAWLGLTRVDSGVEIRGRLWGWCAWCFVGSILIAEWRRPRRRDHAWAPIDRLWLWFRDHWGCVWALRTRDRFNATASAVGWRLRLEWQGANDGGEPIPDEAAATLANLLRRFADRRTLDSFLQTPDSDRLANPGPPDHDGKPG